jgi:hypothetical protein
MTRIKARVWRNFSSPRGSNRYFWSAQVTAEAIVITKMTAPDMPIAVEIDFETPRNGQIPKNRLSTKLFTRIALTNRIKYSIRLNPFQTKSSLVV